VNRDSKYTQRAAEAHLARALTKSSGRRGISERVIVTVFIYILCRFGVCIGTGRILTGRTNFSPERVQVRSITKHNNIVAAWVDYPENASIVSVTVVKQITFMLALIRNFMVTGISTS